jgi:hypothetical protein
MWRGPDSPVELPARIAGLDAALAHVDGDGLTHGRSRRGFAGDAMDRSERAIRSWCEAGRDRCTGTPKDNTESSGESCRAIRAAGPPFYQVAQSSLGREISGAGEGTSSSPQGASHRTAPRHADSIPPIQTACPYQTSHGGLGSLSENPGSPDTRPKAQRTPHETQRASRPHLYP